MKQNYNGTAALFGILSPPNSLFLFKASPRGQIFLPPGPWPCWFPCRPIASESTVALCIFWVSCELKGRSDIRTLARISPFLV